MTDDALTRDLERMLGSRALVEHVRESLTRLRNANGPLAEMARDLLAGHIDLRAVSHSAAYAEPLLTAAQRYSEWFNDLDPRDQETVMVDARAELGRLEGRENQPTAQSD